MLPEGIVCPNCKRLHQNANGRCPNPDCHSKHAVRPLELVQKVRGKKCPHDIPRLLPCEKCGTSNEDCEVYRRTFLVEYRDFFVTRGKNRAEAWELAKLTLSDVDKYLAEGTLSQDLL